MQVPKGCAPCSADRKGRIPLKQTKTAAQRVKITFVILLFLTAAVLSLVFMGRVAINYDLADYLGSDTETKIALTVIEEDFGMTGNIQVMAKQISSAAAGELRDRIKALPHVLNVSFDADSETYYRNGDALFIVLVDGDDYSANAKQVAADIQSMLSGYSGMEYGGTTMEKQALQDAITQEMVFILAISICLVVAILLITSESWLEPFVLLAASGVAILLNRGSNIIFGEISYITNSIAAILQLALSIDYSIVLLHAYRKEKATHKDNGAAMHAAIRSVVKPVSASALTTVAGLLALLFMSFRIGFDIGIVLMKGIVISAITSLTLLPALVLLCERPLRKTHKRAFVPKGKAFCSVASRIAGDIVPSALILILVCAIVQSSNSFLFTDSSAGNTEITNRFGRNNSVVAVYPNTGDTNANEQRLAERLAAYRTESGKAVLTGYTAYSNTVRAMYDIDTAVRKLNLKREDAEMLYTLYRLYESPQAVKMTAAEFFRFASDLVATDTDAKAFADENTSRILQTVCALADVLDTELTAAELYDALHAAMPDSDLSLSSVRHLYGLYFYDGIPQRDVPFRTMLDFLLAASATEPVSGMLGEGGIAQLRLLSSGIAQFEAQAMAPMTKAGFRTWAAENYGFTLSDFQVSLIYATYFTATGEPSADTIPLLPLLGYLADSGLITDAAALATIASYRALHAAIDTAVPDDEFLPTLVQISSTLSGQTPTVSVSSDSIRHLYILYFLEAGTVPDSAMTGETFAEFARSADQTDPVIHAQLTDRQREQLNDLLTLNRHLSDTTPRTAPDIHETLTALAGEIQSVELSTLPGTDHIRGVFVKYAVGKTGALTEPIMACDLLDFVVDHMNSDALLKRKMSEEKRETVADAQADIARAETLFHGKNHSRMLLSVDLPNESEETTAFVDALSGMVREIFDEGACIAGNIVSTRDLEKIFSGDNRLITVFTLVSIFLIVLLIFRSLSLPILLVAVIEGAILIAMSTQIFTGGVFFMSYIVSTCILMGATIDYGILMSGNYVAYRSTLDKKEALRRSVAAAMPTIFTSGMILTVCGFVIHFISSQNSISTVGLLIGIGALSSVFMITVVLPSLLYLLDTFVLKLSIRKKN